MHEDILVSHCTVYEEEQSILGSWVPDVYVISAMAAQNCTQYYRWIKNDEKLL